MTLQIGAKKGEIPRLKLPLASLFEESLIFIPACEQLHIGLVGQHANQFRLAYVIEKQAGLYVRTYVRAGFIYTLFICDNCSQVVLQYINKQNIALVCREWKKIQSNFRSGKSNLHSVRAGWSVPNLIWQCSVSRKSAKWRRIEKFRDS